MNVNNALSHGLDTLSVVALALIALKVAAWTARLCRASRAPSVSEAVPAVAECAVVVAA